MSMSCTASNTIIGLWFLVIGVPTAGFGIRAWLRTRAFDWKETPIAIGGVLASIFGIWTTVRQFRCAFPLPNLARLIGPLELRFLAPQIVFVIFVAFVGYQNTKSLRVNERIAAIAVYALCAFAASEVAAFHTGIQAERWFVVFMAMVSAGALGQSIYTRMRKA